MLIPSRQTLKITNKTNIVVGGNSLVEGPNVSIPFPTAILNTAPVLGKGAAVQNKGVSGWTTRQVDGKDGGSSTGIDGAWISGCFNILILWEITNSVQTGLRTAAQAVSDMQICIANRRAANPWNKIGLLTTLPRQQGFTNTDNSQTNIDALNAILLQANAMLLANYRAMGADFIVDVRAPGSPFNVPDFSPATFAGLQSLFVETAIPRVHTNNAGVQLEANMMSLALRRLTVR